MAKQLVCLSRAVDCLQNFAAIHRIRCLIAALIGVSVVLISKKVGECFHEVDITGIISEMVRSLLDLDIDVLGFCAFF